MNTLLDLTQDILAAMDSDEVNSINDTTESQSVVRIIKRAYMDIAARANLPRHNNVFQLVPSNDTTKPVTMTLPSNVASVEWIKYDWATTENPEINLTDVHPLPLHDFLATVLALNSTEPDVFTYTQVIDGQVMTFLGKNSRGPRYYTTADDRTILFDSYDASMDSTLQAEKSLAFGQKNFPWQSVDTFVPDLDERQFALLFNEAKSMCFAELKQSAHPKAEEKSRKHWINQQSGKTKVPLQTAHMRGPNYGRK